MAQRGGEQKKKMSAHAIRVAQRRMERVIMARRSNENEVLGGRCPNMEACLAIKKHSQ